ncbi:MAG: hypothetical protein ACRDGA_03855, partial [Bacteroidota bacterium]
SDLQKGFQLRQLLRPQIAVAAARSGGMNATPELSILIAEVRDLKRVIKTIEIQQPINIRGTLEGQRFLRDEMPKYRDFEKKKYLDE